jgi:chromate transporter
MARAWPAAIPALIGDDTPTPPHARFSKKRLAQVLAAGAVAVAAAHGRAAGLAGLGRLAGNTLAQMGWFFTKAALLTFGGAYAVLPYVYQGAVEQHQWLSGPQMIDGLALGETTPGPLIMVVAFVGFVGGWTKAGAGAGRAVPRRRRWPPRVVTFFTFLPSFIFILAGGPLVESTHGKLGFTAPLSAITAAVVGVILNLALFFAYHVLWPQGLRRRLGRHHRGRRVGSVPVQGRRDAAAGRLRGRRAGGTSRPSPPGCMRCRWACLKCSRTTMKCCAMAW